MIDPIQLHQVMTLLGIHALFGTLLFGVGYGLLPVVMRKWHAIILLLIWGWSFSSLFNFYLQDTGFFSWFLDPSRERNLTALVNTTFLMMIGLGGLILMRRRVSERQPLAGLYWLLISLLFLFLAFDEYFAIHESIVFWRGGYLLLGGSVALMTLVRIWKTHDVRRNSLIMFLIGLGTMGVSGVVLDAFSTQNLLDIGPIELAFIRCDGEFLGVLCRDYSNTEELLELFGSATMVLSLVTFNQQAHTLKDTRQSTRLIYAGGIVWLILLIVNFWFVPGLQVLNAIPAHTKYDDISLIGYDISRQRAQPDDTVDVNLYLRTDTFIDSTYSLSLHLWTYADAESIAQDDMELGEFEYPTTAWIPGLTVRNHFRLVLPEDIQTNQSYQLVAILWEDTPQNPVAVQETNLKVMGDGTTLILDGVAVPSTTLNPVPTVPSFEFAGDFSLIGHQLPETAYAGDDVSFDFWWEAQQDVHVAATQFIHWLHIETGEYLVFDRVPFDGNFPTSDWVADIRVQDSWTLTLPADVAPGTYRIQTGLYETHSIIRIPVTDNDGNAVQDNSIVLGQIVVTSD